MVFNVLAPSLCPTVLGSPLLLAHRPFPSIIMAICLGNLLLFSLLIYLSFLKNLSIKLISDLQNKLVNPSQHKRGLQTISSIPNLFSSLTFITQIGRAHV